MDPRMNKGEYNFGERDGSRRPNQAGVFYHPEANKFIETAVATNEKGYRMKNGDGESVYMRDQGKIQADAFVQLGYRPATQEQARDYQAKQEEAMQAKAKSEVYDLSKRGPGRPSNK